jgi:CRP-like cAMP-binding protein
VEQAATLSIDLASAPVATPESYPPIDRGWLRRPSLGTDELRTLPLFTSLDDEHAHRVLRAAREHHALPEEAIVEQWQVSRDLYVVLEGEAEVTADGTALATHGPGEFFGELAAIDWGAGFGRTRSATVTATSPTRLLVLDWALVNWLMQADATFAEQLERTSRERLSRRSAKPIC